MKNFRLLIVLFAFISVLSACKKDEEKPLTTEQKIVGKWNVKKIIEKDYENDVLKQTTETAGKAGDYMEFTASKTIVLSLNGKSSSGTYQVLNDKAMTITVDGRLSTVTIDKLDAAQFNLTFTSSITDSGKTYKYVSAVELTK